MGWRSRAVDVVILSILIGLVLFNLILTAPPKVSINDTTYHNQQAYEAAVKEEFLDIRTKTKLTLNSHRVADNLKKRFPELSNVEVNVPMVGAAARVKLKVAKPAFKLVSGGELYVINSNGTASALAANLNGTENLPEIVDESGFKIQLGQPVLEAAAVSFIASLNQQLKLANIQISSLALPPRAKELILRTADQPYYIKFYLGGDSATQAGQYLATRQQFIRDGLTPSEYLDVRVQGKVFYK